MEKGYETIGVGSNMVEDRKVDVSIRNYEELAEEYMKCGQDELMLDNFDGAVENINKALSILKKVGSDEKYVIDLNVLGVIYDNAGYEDKAFECFLEGIAMTRIMKNCSYLKALCDINVGSCYQKMERHERAIEYFRHAQKELQNPSVKSVERLQVWGMVNYIKLKDSYGKIGIENDEQYDDELLVFA